MISEMYFFYSKIVMWPLYFAREKNRLNLMLESDKDNIQGIKVHLTVLNNHLYQVCSDLLNS